MGYIITNDMLSCGSIYENDEDWPNEDDTLISYVSPEMFKVNIAGSGTCDEIIKSMEDFIKIIKEVKEIKFYESVHKNYEDDVMRMTVDLI